jgi:ubiquinone/menaquinone biosynthesis C-methylase UbiE
MRIVTIHPWAADGFTRGAAEYDQARPGYPSAAVALLGLGPGMTVVDVAAGTGKLTRQLLGTGARVVAVEPLEAMRELIPADGIEILGGTGEAVPLPSGSADVVTVAQAFHWFRVPEALVEMHRILRPGGLLALLWNRRDPEDPVQREFKRILARHRAHPSLEGSRDIERALEADPLFAGPDLRTFRHAQELAREDLVAQAASESSIAVLEGEARTAALADFASLADTLPPRFELRFTTDVVSTRTIRR